jgi:hypothetical protein
MMAFLALLFLILQMKVKLTALKSKAGLLFLWQKVHCKASIAEGRLYHLRDLSL